MSRKKFQRYPGRLILFSSVIFFTLILFIAIPRFSLPFIMAYLIELTFRPLTTKLLKLNFSPTITSSIIIFVLITSLSIPLIKIFPLLKEESENIQFYLPKVEKFIELSYEKIQNIAKEDFNFELGKGPILDLMTWIRVGLKNLIFYKMPNLLARLIEWLVLIPFFLFFFIKDSQKFKHALLRLVPNSIYERSYFVLAQFHSKLANYLWAKFIEASIIGLTIGIGLFILDIRFAVLLGLTAAITNIVPYLGPFLGSIPAFLVCLIEYGTGSKLLSTLGLYGVANIIDIGIIFPILVSKIVDLHPIYVVGSVIVGGQLMGPLGMVLSIPMAVIFKLIFSEIYKRSFSNEQSIK